LAGRALFGLLCQPRMINDDKCGAVGGMIIGRGNRRTRKRNFPQCHFVHHKSHMTSAVARPRMYTLQANTNQIMLLTDIIAVCCVSRTRVNKIQPYAECRFPIDGLIHSGYPRFKKNVVWIPWGRGQLPALAGNRIQIPQSSRPYLYDCTD
jgi:hypothetical protein